MTTRPTVRLATPAATSERVDAGFGARRRARPGRRPGLIAAAVLLVPAVRRGRRPRPLGASRLT